MKWAVIFVVLTLAVFAGLTAWRFSDDRALAQRWAELQASASKTGAKRFDPLLLARLPEPVQRYFRAVIEPGTLLRTVAEIHMHGQMSLGNKESPGYMPMRACQLLAAPDGFIWQVRAGQGPTRFVGSDAAFATGSWTRFWYGGLIPVARAGDDPDHMRSSFGRYVAEAAFWTPAALLPSKSVHWEALGSDDVRVTVSRRGLSQSVDLRLDRQGLPVQVQFRRWSNANSAKVYQWQQFGGYLSAFESFNGFKLPTRVDAGNFFGTEQYFPFYQVTVDAIRFPGPKGGRNCTI